MSILMGASGAIFKDRFTTDCKCVETRQYPYRNSDCWGVTEKAINNNIYLIFNISWKSGESSQSYNPTDWEWKHRVEMVVQKLISYGGNKNNCRITIINEPMKRLTKEKYAHLVGLAYQQINGRFQMGAGNEEFRLSEAKGGMYQYILRQANFDILDIHIQGSCLDEDSCKYWTERSASWASQYNKILDCTEANYSDVAKSGGYNTLLMQLRYAEKIGCINFPMVFIGLSNESKYRWLSFIYNGRVRSPYWEEYKQLIKDKAPIQPIPEPIIERKDGMIIKTIGNKATDVKGGYGVLLMKELLLYHGFLAEEALNFKFDEAGEEALKDFQTSVKDKYDIVVDGRCGRMGWRYLIKEVEDLTLRKEFQFDLEVIMSPYNIKGDT